MSFEDISNSVSICPEIRPGEDDLPASSHTSKSIAAYLAKKESESGIKCEGKKIRSGYLPFRKRILHRPRQNDHPRLMFGE
ncbi:hypothetical protein TNCV_1363221 [Trichonephila clavipes]|nr:hypothetical protein TNCV_1363221 [Trichonephila clavipes]